MRAQIRILINNFIGSLLREKIDTHINKTMVFKTLKKSIIHRNKVISGTLWGPPPPPLIACMRGGEGGFSTSQKLND